MFSDKHKNALSAYTSDETRHWVGRGKTSVTRFLSAAPALYSTQGPHIACWVDPHRFVPSVYRGENFTMYLHLVTRLWTRETVIEQYIKAW